MAEPGRDGEYRRRKRRSRPVLKALGNPHGEKWWRESYIADIIQRVHEAKESSQGQANPGDDDMIEDKLTHHERLRLEALAQSIALNAHRNPAPEKVLSDAREFAKFVEEGPAQ